MRSIVQATLVAIGCVLTVALPVSAQEALRATLKDVAWISGQWLEIMDGGARSEEVWTQPNGDSMLGMWRLVSSAGQTRVLELIAITADAGSLTFRLRHFTRDFVPREDKDKAIALPLKSLSPGLVVFEGQGSEGLLRMTYRQTAPEAIEVSVEHGPKPKQVFRLTRKAQLQP